jgi:hypothetical protein
MVLALAIRHDDKRETDLLCTYMLLIYTLALAAAKNDEYLTHFRFWSLPRDY